MLRRNLFGTTVLCATALIAQSAAAEITAQDVWDSYTASYESIGAQVIGSPAVDGDETVVADGALLFRLPFDVATVRVTMPEMRMTEQSDGTVVIAYPESYDVTIEVDVPNEGSGSAILGIAQANYANLATGEPGDITYKVSADSATVQLKDLVLPEGAAEFSLLAEGGAYSSETRVVVADMVTTTNDLDYGAVDVAYILTDPSGAIVSNTGRFGASTTTYESSLPAGGSDVMQLSSVLTAGAYLRGTSESEGGASETVTTLDGDMISQQTQSSGKTTTRFELDEIGMEIFGEVTETAFSMLMPDLFPFAIEGNIGSAVGGYQFPLLPKEEAQDVALRLDFSDVVLSDDIWNLFDPNNQLPRDPATINIDAEATVISGLDLLDFATLEQQFAQPVPPISLETLTINDLEVSAIGASATGSGEFTVDNSDTTTFEGFPRPEGDAILNVSGANALIDRLVAFGIIGQEEAGMARLGMGFVARSTGDDSFETNVEINAEGHVLVNGQRMR